MEKTKEYVDNGDDDFEDDEEEESMLQGIPVPDIILGSQSSTEEEESLWEGIKNDETQRRGRKTGTIYSEFPELKAPNYKAPYVPRGNTATIAEADEK